MYKPQLTNHNNFALDDGFNLSEHQAPPLLRLPHLGLHTYMAPSFHAKKAKDARFQVGNNKLGR